MTNSISDLSITEQRYLEMSVDCRDRLQKKNEKIKELTKLLFISYTLVRMGLEHDDNSFYEHLRAELSEWLDESIFDD